jgi:hypothetical protein
MSETPFDSPVEDVAEQRTEIVPDLLSDEESGVPDNGGPRPEPSWEADPADAAEQEAEVPIDEDEWR